MFKTILLFIIMLSVIIIIHEGGHFIAAKAFNVYCHEFSIGMGPKIFSKKGKETIYSIRALPFGGYVAMAGEKDENPGGENYSDENIPKERTLSGVHPVKRIIIMASGIIMNFVLALVLVSMLFLNAGQAAVSPDARIAKVETDYPAYKAGIKVDDLITGASFDNGYKIAPKSFTELSDFLSLYDGNGNVHLTIERNGEELNINVKPVYDETSASYRIGISSYEYKSVDVNFFNCWKHGFDYLVEMTKLILMTLLGLFRGVGLDNLSGPVGVYQVTKEAVNYGYETYINLIAVISLNVGLFNALPLPVFDGGRILLTVIEMVRGKPLNKEVENKIMIISTMVLFAFVILVTFKDIFNLFKGA